MDIDFLLDSGLLYEINRSLLHLAGIALVVKTGPKGKSLELKDGRLNPEKIIFSPEQLEAGAIKIRKFINEFITAQDSKRCAALGWGVQSRFHLGV